MLRKMCGTFAVVLVLCVGAVLADEIKGVIKKVDVDGKKITVTVDGKDKDYDVADDAKIQGRGKNPGTLKTLAAAVDKAGDNGYKAVITTDNDSKKVTEIKRDRSKTATPPQ
jgi:Cu/Ag efflux protein CusF